MIIENELTKMLNLRFPVIMAPMFLVSNVQMADAGMAQGIASVLPSLNFREESEFISAIIELNKKHSSYSQGIYGINLIVGETNPYYKRHLEICAEYKVPFFITSLGNPKEVIEKAKKYGARVFCDVTNLKHAAKCYDLGCDGFIVVSQGAGGHAGPHAMHLLVSSLRLKYPEKVVVAAGGIANGDGILSALASGASGVSIGTRFIASFEAAVSDEYKNAIVNSTMDDIVMTTRISGTPCSVINTPFAKQIGYEQNWLEKLLMKNARTKKLYKMLVQYKGMKWLESSIHPGNYKSLWTAGESVELIHEILSCKEIIKKLEEETFVSYQSLQKQFIAD